jgi:site-specific DNA recombinase
MGTGVGSQDPTIRKPHDPGRIYPRVAASRSLRPELYLSERSAGNHRALGQAARIFEELDESGGRSDRPLLLEAIGRVEDGHSDGIIVAYLSRFGRSLLDGLVFIKRITEAGGKFISVKEDFDFSTETGRLMLRVMFSIGEWELERTRANWEAARGRAIARGAWTASTPVGYQRGRDGRLAIDLVSGPVIAELFRRRADGASITELQRLLTDRGITTATGKSYWHYGVTARLFEARVYRGEQRHGQYENLEAHPPPGR